jgi:hypothetical protein
VRDASPLVANPPKEKMILIFTLQKVGEGFKRLQKPWDALPRRLVRRSLGVGEAWAEAGRYF